MNILPNTQWQICTTVADAPKMNKDGAGTLPAIAISGYSLYNNLTTFYCADTSQLKVGDLVKFVGAPDPHLGICSLEVEQLVPNSHFVAGLPLGKGPISQGPCAAHPIMPADLAGTVGAGPDGWTKTPALSFWIDDNVENQKPGSKRQIGLKKSDPNPQHFFHNAPFPYRFQGKPLAFGVFAMPKNGGTWRAFINTDSGIVYSTTSGTTGYEWLEVSAQIPDNATFIHIGVELLGGVGSVYYVSQPCAKVGTSVGYYEPRVNEILNPVVKMTPLSYIGAHVAMPTWLDGSGVYASFPFRPYPETNGAVGKDIVGFDMQMEGRNGQVDRSLGVVNQEAPPHIYSLLIASKQNTELETMAGFVTLNNGTARVYTASPGCTFFNVSFDINRYQLS